MKKEDGRGSGTERKGGRELVGKLISLRERSRMSPRCFKPGAASEQISVINTLNITEHLEIFKLSCVESQRSRQLAVSIIVVL